MKTLSLREPSCPFSSHGFGRARGTFSRTGRKYSRMREHPPERAEHSTTWEEQPLKSEEHSSESGKRPPKWEECPKEREERHPDSEEHPPEHENIFHSERNILWNESNILQNRRKIPPEPGEHFPDSENILESERNIPLNERSIHQSMRTSPRAVGIAHTYTHGCPFSCATRIHTCTCRHANSYTGGGYTYMFVHTMSTSSQVCSEQEKWTSSFILNYSWHSQPIMYWILIVCLLKMSYNLCVLLFYGINKKLIVTIKKRLKGDTLWR